MYHCSSLFYGNVSTPAKIEQEVVIEHLFWALFISWGKMYCWELKDEQPAQMYCKGERYIESMETNWKNV